MKRTSKLPRSLPFAPRKLAFFVAAALSGTLYAAASSAVEPSTAAELLGMPISFERNVGQYPADVLFVSRGLQGVLALRSGEVAITPRRDGLSGRGEPVRLRLAGANLAPEVETAQPVATRSHHYLGNGPSSRFERVPHFGELQLRDVYPGIDMVLHGRDGSLEYDFVVAAGADPKDIRIDLRGADRVSLDAEGNLRLGRGQQDLTQHAPLAFQGDGAQRRAVDARFELVEGVEGPEARIVLGSYDPGEALTVDPVIGYSTYVGSSGNDGGTIVRVDDGGDLYFTQLGASGSVDAVVIDKLDPHTNTVVYETHFGGHGFTTANDLALGGPGSTTLYVAGTTRALDFPVVPLKRDASSDAFVAVLAPDGTLSSTRLIGGSGSDLGNAIALDADGNVYLAGSTTSPDLGVTVGPTLLNRVGASGAADGFVAKLDVSLATTYLRYLGGSGGDSIVSLAVDDMGQAIVVGSTSSQDFPQVNVGAPASPPPPPFQLRGFAAKVSDDGASLVYSEYVGGSSFSADAVALDPSTGEAVVGGTTFRNDLVPTPVSPFHGGFDAYVVRLDSVGKPTFATYLGGSGNDIVEAITVATNGDVYVTGSTRSRDFPVVRALTGMGTLDGPSDAFVTRLSDGVPDFSTYLGGSGDDTGTSLAIGPDGGLYVGGFTHSVDFPTQHPFRATRSGPTDGFITKIVGVRSPGPPRLPPRGRP